MKVKIDTVNIWYSPHLNRWMSCALIVRGPGGGVGKEELAREKTEHKSLEEAFKFVSSRYKGCEELE